MQMHAIFIIGTAGSGKSLLTSTLTSWYMQKGSHAISVNLDPGASSLPYTPDVDVRNHIDLQTIMDSYQLGPNGALIFACDLMATKLNDIQNEIEELNPDYAIIDTSGQVELFAYRSSGPYIVQNLRCEGRASLFLLDAPLVSSPTNFVSLVLFAASLQLRLSVAQVPVLTKRDLVGPKLKDIMMWASSPAALEEMIKQEAGDYQYLLSSRILHDLVRLGFSYELIPVSSVTQQGLVELSSTLANILRRGEDVEA